MYILYNDIYFFDNNKSKCRLTIYSPVREVDQILEPLTSHNYWLIIANENYTDEGLSLPGDVKQFLYNILYKFGIPYNKAVYIENHNIDTGNFSQQLHNVVILDSKFPTTDCVYRPIERKEIDYLKTGLPIKPHAVPPSMSEGWEALVEYWKQYVYCNV